MPSLMSRLRNAWNAFQNRDPTDVPISNFTGGYITSYRPDRVRYTRGNQRSIVSSIYNRIALDVAGITIVHAKVDENGQFLEKVNSGLENCLNLEANLDQTGKELIQDIVESMFDEGVVAVIPTDTDYDPTGESEKFDILTLRTGRITAWYPEHIRVDCYNQRTGKREEIVFPKSSCAIIENPFYATMNEPNSILQRLKDTINHLDDLNFRYSSGKLDLIIQLPYLIKSEKRKEEAERRRADIERQLTDTKYGVAYTDGTEKIVQLNRSLENNLWEQVKDLTTQLYNQLGLTQAIIDGTADEQASINYFNNTITPICDAICNEFKRKFLSKTARTQGQSVIYYRDPFKLVPVDKLADIGDKFRRNEIMTSNELRGKIGMKPVDTQDANSLRNPNLNKSDNDPSFGNEEEYPDEEEYYDQNEEPDSGYGGEMGGPAVGHSDIGRGSAANRELQRAIRKVGKRRVV